MAIGRLLSNCSYNHLDASPWMKFGWCYNYSRQGRYLICVQLLLNRMIFRDDRTNYLNRVPMMTDMNMSIAVQLNVGWLSLIQYSNVESVNNYTYRYFTNGQRNGWSFCLFVLKFCLQSQIGKLLILCGKCGKKLKIVCIFVHFFRQLNTMILIWDLLDFYSSVCMSELN